jgi:hypothetical protein
MSYIGKKVNLSKVSEDLQNLQEKLEKLSINCLRESCPSLICLRSKLRLGESQLASVRMLKDALFPSFAASFANNKVKLNVGGGYLDMKRSSLVNGDSRGWNLLV